MDGGISNYAFNKSLKNDTGEVKTLFVVKTLLAFTVLIFAWGVLVLVGKPFGVFILLYGTAVIFTSNISFIKFIARGLGFYKIDLIAIVLEPLLRFVFLVVIFLLSARISIAQLYWAYIIMGIVSLTYVYLVVFVRLKGKIEWKKIYNKFRPIFNGTKYFMLYYFFQVGLQRLDVLYIENKLGTKEVAFFSAGLNIISSVQLFLAALITSRLKNALKESHNKRRSLFIQIFAVSFGFSLILFTFSKQIFSVVYPREYLPFHIVLRNISFVLPFFCMTYLNIYLNNYRNRQLSNVFILGFYFLLKCLILVFFNFNSIQLVSIELLLFEIMAGLTFIFISINEFKSTSGK